MRSMALMCLGLAAMAGWSSARGGEVWTTDGRCFSGAVRVEADGTISMNTPGVSRLRSDDILYAWFGTPRSGTAGEAGALVLNPQMIGVSKPGQVSQSNGVYSFRGSGLGVAGTADNCTLFSRGTSSDVQIIGRLREVLPSGCAAGLMIRADMEPGSPFAMIGANSTGDLVFRHRDEAGGKAVEQAILRVKFPIWMKLVRRGRNCAWYKSKAGLQWELGGEVIPDAKYAEWSKGDRRTPEPGLSFGDRASAGVVVVGTSVVEARAAMDKMRIQELEAQNIKGAVKAPVAEGTITFVSVRLGETAKGVWLSDGSFLPRAGVVSINEKVAKIEEGPMAQTEIPIGRMARVNLAPLGAQLAASVPGDTSGVLLNSAGFMEGQIKSWKNNRVTVSSIVFGLSSFKVPDEARALSWRRPTEKMSNALVMLNDGTSLAATTYRTEESELVVTGPTLGSRRIALREVNVIRANVSRAVPLAQLMPRKLEGPAGENVVAGSSMDPVWGSLLSCKGRGASFGIALPVGAEVTYDIPPGCKRFTCWVSVPDQGGAGGAIEFLVNVDGKPINQTKPTRIDSVKPMATLSLPIEGSTITLRAQSTDDADTGYVVWGDAMLSK